MLRRLFEQPRGASANQRQHSGPAEDVDVGEQGGLLLHEAVDEAEGARARGARAHAMAEILGDHGRSLLQHGARLRQAGAKFVLVEIGAADDGGGGHGNANGPADVAQHVEETGGVAHLLRGNGARRHGGQRNENEAQRETGDHNRKQKRVRTDRQIDRAEDERAGGKTQKAGAEQLAIVDARTEKSDHRRADERSDVAGPPPGLR